MTETVISIEHSSLYRLMYKNPCRLLQICGGVNSRHAALHFPNKNIISWKSNFFFSRAFVVMHFQDVSCFVFICQPSNFLSTDFAVFAILHASPAAMEGV